MKLNPSFLMHRIADSAAVVPCDNEEKNIVFRLNGTAAFLWEVLAKGNADEHTLVSALVQEYGISEAQASEGVSTFLSLLRQYGALIEE